IMDVALLMANASQLKAALEQGPRFSLYTPIITLISISLFLQVTVGVLLIFIVLLSVLVGVGEGRLLCFFAVYVRVNVSICVSAHVLCMSWSK
uniref:Ninjurin 1 n=1 Tax=Sander lucioperca TaxID=283035 RepID=A0A8D0ADR8_SANLU